MIEHLNPSEVKHFLNSLSNHAEQGISTVINQTNPETNSGIDNESLYAVPVWVNINGLYQLTDELTSPPFWEAILKKSPEN